MNHFILLFLRDVYQKGLFKQEIDNHVVLLEYQLYGEIFIIRTTDKKRNGRNHIATIMNENNSSNQLLDVYISYNNSTNIEYPEIKHKQIIHKKFQNNNLIQFHGKSSYNGYTPITYHLGLIDSLIIPRTIIWKINDYEIYKGPFLKLNILSHVSYSIMKKKMNETIIYSKSANVK